MTHYAYLRP